MFAARIETNIRTHQNHRSCDRRSQTRTTLQTYWPVGIRWTSICCFLVHFFLLNSTLDWGWFDLTQMTQIDPYLTFNRLVISDLFSGRKRCLFSFVIMSTLNNPSGFTFSHWSNDENAFGEERRLFVVVRIVFFERILWVFVEWEASLCSELEFVLFPNDFLTIRA